MAVEWGKLMTEPQGNELPPEHEPKTVRDTAQGQVSVSISLYEPGRQSMTIDVTIETVDPLYASEDERRVVVDRAVQGIKGALRARHGRPHSNGQP